MKRFLVIFTAFTLLLGNVGICAYAKKNNNNEQKIEKVKQSKSNKKAQKKAAKKEAKLQKRMAKISQKEAKLQAKKEAKAEKLQAKENKKQSKLDKKQAAKAEKQALKQSKLDKKQAVKAEKQALKQVKLDEKLQKAQEREARRISRNKNMDPNFVPPTPYIKTSIKSHFLNPNLDVYEVRASHILVKKRKDAVQIRKDILNGDITFEEAAKRFSLCPSGQFGGDLGFFNRKKMDQLFADTAFDLRVGEISQPVGTKFGWHIIKTTDKR